MIFNNNIDTIFNINDTKFMEELLKNIKIDDEISIILINKFSKINKIYSTNNRHKFALMIKDRGQTIYYQNGKKLDSLPTEVGTYTVKVKIDNGNYVLKGVIECVFTIVESEVSL